VVVMAVAVAVAVAMEIQILEPRAGGDLLDQSLKRAVSTCKHAKAFPTAFPLFALSVLDHESRRSKLSTLPCAATTWAGT
jgi:hypothetical protein